LPYRSRAVNLLLSRDCADGRGGRKLDVDLNPTACNEQSRNSITASTCKSICRKFHYPPSQILQVANSKTCRCMQSASSKSSIPLEVKYTYRQTGELRIAVLSHHCFRKLWMRCRNESRPNINSCPTYLTTCGIYNNQKPSQ
jgi:hypothetical protein